MQRHKLFQKPLRVISAAALAVTLVVATLMPAQAADMTYKKDNADNTLPGYVKANYKDGYLDKKMPAYRVYYDDSFFYENTGMDKEPTVGQKDLIKLSMAASAAVYSKKNAKELMEQCKFEEITPDYKKATIFDTAVVNSTIGLKKIGNLTIIAIWLKGTGSIFKDPQWLSNLEVLPANSNSTYHQGFSRAAEYAYEQLENFLNKNNNKIYGEKRFWITGHSRGAAVANLLASRLTEQYSKKRVYAYTFATPNVTKKKNGYSNIVNFCNQRDIVTNVPSTPYKRNGKNIYVSKQIKPKMKNQYRKITQKSYREPTLKTLAKIGTSLVTAALSLGDIGCPHSQTAYIAWLEAQFPTTHAKVPSDEENGDDSTSASASNSGNEFTLISGETFSDFVPTNKCGDKVYWKLDRKKETLYIYGKGKMWDFWTGDELTENWQGNRLDYATGEMIDIASGLRQAPWNEPFKQDNGIISTAYTGAFRHIVVEDGVTSIGNGAFFSYAGVASVYLPNSIKRIGKSAFQMCMTISEITIPEKIEKIEDGTFYACKKLKTVKLSENLKKIGKYAFAECVSLKKIDFPAGLNRIDDFAFMTTGLEGEVSIPEGVEYLGTYCFSYMGGEPEKYKKIKQITIKNRACMIGAYVVDQDVCVCGYPYSDAQEYAEAYGNLFKPL